MTQHERHAQNVTRSHVQLRTSDAGERAGAVFKFQHRYNSEDRSHKPSKNCILARELRVGHPSFSDLRTSAVGSAFSHRATRHSPIIHNKNNHGPCQDKGHREPGLPPLFVGERLVTGSHVASRGAATQNNSWRHGCVDFSLFRQLIAVVKFSFVVTCSFQDAQ